MATTTGTAEPEALDAGDFDVIGAEERRHVDGGRLVGLADLGRALFLAIERLDADHLALFVVVEVGAGLPAEAEHVGYG